MNLPDNFIIYFRLHKIIKVFSFIFVYNFLSAIFREVTSRMKFSLPPSCLSPITSEKKRLEIFKFSFWPSTLEEG
jgi:hypothetical protein